MVIFRALRATLVHFADFVTGHGTSCAPCAVCHTPGALCTFIRAYSMWNLVNAGTINFKVLSVKIHSVASQLTSHCDRMQRYRKCLPIGLRGSISSLSGVF